MSDKKTKSISNSDLYGKTDTEKWVEKKEEIYQIKNEINNFGITDKQRYFLLYVLSMEIENVENSRTISNIVLQCCPEINILNDVNEE